MSEFLLVSVFENDKTKECSITAVVADYDGESSPKVVDHFSSKGTLDSIKHVYFDFENFVFGHQRAELAFWGKFHVEKLQSMSDVVDGDFRSQFDLSKAKNLQFMFKNKLKMKRFVGFRDAYTKISGMKMLFSEKGKEFNSLENMAHFLPYVIGNKRINRIDIKSKEKKED